MPSVLTRSWKAISQKLSAALAMQLQEPSLHDLQCGQKHELRGVQVRRESALTCELGPPIKGPSYKR